MSGKILDKPGKNQLLPDILPVKRIKTNFYQGFFCLGKVFPSQCQKIREPNSFLKLKK